MLKSKIYIPYNVAMQRARDKLKPKAPPLAQSASAGVDNCWSRDRTAPSSLSTDTGTPVSYARVAARGGTANRGPSRKNPINPRPGQSSQAAARAPDGKTQSVAKRGHSKEVTALFARLFLSRSPHQSSSSGPWCKVLPASCWGRQWSWFLSCSFPLPSNSVTVRRSSVVDLECYLVSLLPVLLVNGGWKQQAGSN